jgi:hypothetical protein
MTFDEFLTSLAAARPLIKRSTDGAGAIRLYPTAETFQRVVDAGNGGSPAPCEDATFCFCPITAVAFAETGEVFRIDNYDTAADRIGLPDVLKHAIVGAADCYSPRQLAPLYPDMGPKNASWGGTGDLTRFEVRAALERTLELTGGITRPTA